MPKAHTPEPRRCRCDLFTCRGVLFSPRTPPRPPPRRVPGRPGRGAPEGRAPRESVSETATPRDVRLVSASVCHLLIVWRLSPPGLGLRGCGAGAGRRSAASRLSVSRLRLEVASPDPGHTAHTAGRCTHCALSMAAPRCMRGGSRYTLSDTVFESWVNCHFCCLGPASPQLL